ncbi:MAG: GerMN domain-containing protein [Chloroflexota bacterium]
MADLSKYRAVALLAALFVLGALLRPVAASQQAAATVTVADQYGSAAVTLYFLEETGAYLIPVSRRVVDEAEQTPARALAELLAGPKAGPLVPFFEGGATLLDLTIKSGQAKIALSMPEMVEQLSTHAMDGLRWTMTEFEEIEQIAVTVNGWSVDADGKFVDQITPLARPAAINSQFSGVGHPVMLYFGYGADPSLLVPVTTYLATTDSKTTDRETVAGDAQITQIIEQLLVGPPAGSHLLSTIPETVHLLDVHMDGVIANVNFSEELVIAYRLKEANALHVRKAVIATLTSLPGVYAGSIKIGGSSLLYFTCQNAVMEHPQAKPWAINDEFYM